MFTGLVEQLGDLRSRSAHGSSATLMFGADFSASGPLVVGESIACDGACLTVVRFDKVSFEVDASPETLARTTLGSLRIGAPVNLERALQANARLGGHVVTGHIDDVACLASRTTIDGSLVMRFELPLALARFVAEKGSIAVNGVSLTVNRVTDAEAEGQSSSFEITLIPHTQEKTNLVALAAGAMVNLEIDLMARYAARLLTGPTPAASQDAAKDARLMERLRASGYV